MQKLGIVLVAMCITVSSVGADEIQLNAVRTGRYDEVDGRNPTGSSNYFTGDGGEEHRSFFVFDTSGLADLIPAGDTVAILILELDTANFSSQDPQETLGLFDVHTPLSTIDAGTNFFNTFIDFGSGASYGERVYTDADEQLRREIALNSTAIDDLVTSISGDQEFGIGGAILTLDGTPATGPLDTEFIFGSSQNRSVVLKITTVPEPTPFALCGIWGTSLFVIRRRTRR